MTTEKRFDCSGCDCCSFLVLKTKHHDKVSRKGDNYTIETDRLPISDHNFFLWHRVKMEMNRQHHTFFFKQKGLLHRKVVNGMVYYRIDIKCKHLDKNRLCRIYERRPEACKNAECIRLKPDLEKLYYEDWKVYAV